jgi:hypothetical protein
VVACCRPDRFTRQSSEKRLCFRLQRASALALRQPFQAEQNLASRNAAR